MATIYFDFDEPSLRKDQNQIVTSNVNCYADSSAKLGQPLHLHLTGHTDETISAKKATKLGQQRADAVKAAFTKLGIDATKITTESKGNTEPAVPCKCKEAKNHRVEIKQK